jgi:hypothetical protein
MKVFDLITILAQIINKISKFWQNEKQFNLCRNGKGTNGMVLVQFFSNFFHQGPHLRPNINGVLWISLGCNSAIPG